MYCYDLIMHCMILIVTVATFPSLGCGQQHLGFTFKLLLVSMFVSIVCLVISIISEVPLLNFKKVSCCTGGWDEESPMPRCEDISATIQETVVCHITMRTHRAMKYCKAEKIPISAVVRRIYMYPHNQ